MDRSRDSIYLAVGPMVAIALGVILIPLREVTVASNLTFAFLALTIVVAELGGRWPAVATALVSALSLDFFLTQPYLRLSMVMKNDVVAFVGLAACGLLVAFLGTDRRDRRYELRQARALRAMVGGAIGELASAGPLDARLNRVLNGALATLPLARIVVRDSDDSVLASRPTSVTKVPGTILQGTSLVAGDAPAAGTTHAATRLPDGGGRLKLTAHGAAVGWLDLWGSGRPFEPSQREALGEVAGVVAALVARR
jgi:K+-sensing histidine kinase KdpD